MRVENRKRNETSTSHPRPRVALSPWVNERCPPIHDILSAHDVARLTRRPRWVLVGLCLVGRFPKKARFRGRALGWRRTEVLEWMAHGLALRPEDNTRADTHRRAGQMPLPLRHQEPCSAHRTKRFNPSSTHSHSSNKGIAMKLLRAKEVVKATGLSRMTIWRLEKDGKFPARRTLGMNSVAWLEDDVNTWIASRPAVQPRPA